MKISLQDAFRITSAFIEHSKKLDSTQKALREHLKSTQKAKEQSDFVIPSEPKILRLVYFKLFIDKILSQGKDLFILVFTDLTFNQTNIFFLHCI